MTMVLPARVELEVQRILDAAARRILAEEIARGLEERDDAPQIVRK